MLLLDIKQQISLFLLLLQIPGIYCLPCNYYGVIVVKILVHALNYLHNKCIERSFISVGNTLSCYARASFISVKCTESCDPLYDCNILNETQLS